MGLYFLKGSVLAIPIYIAAQQVECTKRSLKEKKKRFDERVNAQTVWSMTHPDTVSKKVVELSVKLALVRNDTNLWCQRALAYIIQKRYTLAQQDLEEAMKLEKDHFLSHYYMSTVYEMTGNPKSLDMHSRALELYSDKCALDSENWMGDISATVGETIHNWKQSLPDVFGVKELREKRRRDKLATRGAFKQVVIKSDLYNNRGLCLYRKGEYYAALRDFEQAILLAENENEDRLPFYYYNLGLNCFASHDLDQALSYFNSALTNEQSPIASNVYAMKYFTNMRLGNDEQALKDRARALEINPNAPVNQFQFRLLPASILTYIFSFLGTYGLCCLSLSSHQMYDLCNVHWLWPLIYRNRNPHGSMEDPRVKGYPKEVALIQIEEGGDLSLDHLEYTASTLKTLYIYWRSENPDHLPILTDFIGKCENLETLGISLFFRTPVDINWASFVPKKIKHLTIYLSLFRMNEDLVPLLTVLGDNLRSLSVTHLLSFSEKEIEMVLQHCKNVKSFDLSSTQLLSLEYFKEKYNLLRVQTPYVHVNFNYQLHMR